MIYISLPAIPLMFNFVRFFLAFHLSVSDHTLHKLNNLVKLEGGLVFSLRHFCPLAMERPTNTSLTYYQLIIMLYMLPLDNIVGKY